MTIIGSPIREIRNKKRKKEKERKMERKTREMFVTLAKYSSC